MSYPLAPEMFKTQMDRMKANYGEDKFPKEKIALIWEELKEFSPKQVKSICDFVLGNNQWAPTIQPFREFASMLREKLRQFEREQERQDAKDFWEGTYHSDEVKSIVQTIKLRMEGKVTDDEWKQFQEILKKSSKEPKCKKCDDTGVFYDSQTRPFRCNHGTLVRPLAAHAKPSNTAKEQWWNK